MIAPAERCHFAVIAPEAKRIGDFVRGWSVGTAVVALLDVAVALAQASGVSEAQFQAEVRNVLKAREERGVGFGRPAEVRPS